MRLQLFSPASGNSVPTHRRLFTGLLATLALCTLATTAVNAQLTITASSSTAIKGGTGSFDVLLQDAGGNFNIAGFSVEFQAPAGSGIQFTGLTTVTADPYLFGSLQNPPLSFSNFPATDVVGSDSDNANPGYVAVSASSVYGLAHATYSVASNATSGPITITLAPTGTGLVDANTNTIDATLVNGTISVTSPEPASLATLGLAGCAHFFLDDGEAIAEFGF